MLILVILFFKEVHHHVVRPGVGRHAAHPHCHAALSAHGMLAVTIVISVHNVGVALMMAMLVTPAAAAYMLTRALCP